jgi:hypothetical protein
LCEIPETHQAGNELRSIAWNSGASFGRSTATPCTAFRITHGLSQSGSLLLSGTGLYNHCHFRRITIGFRSCLQSVSYADAPARLFLKLLLCRAKQSEMPNDTVPCLLATGQLAQFRGIRTAEIFIASYSSSIWSFFDPMH